MDGVVETLAAILGIEFVSEVFVGRERWEDEGIWGVIRDGWV